MLPNKAIMQLLFLLKKFSRDIVYLCIIGGLLGWIWMDGKRQKDWNGILMKDLGSATSMADYTVEMAEASIQEDYYNYPSSFSEDFFKRAQKLRHAVDTVFVPKLRDLWERSISNDGINNRAFTTVELKELEEVCRGLATTLSNLVDGDNTLNPVIWNSLFGDNLWIKAQSASPIQTMALVKSLRFKAKMLSREILANYYRRGHAPDCGAFPISFAYVWPEKKIYAVGENYNARIHLAYLERLPSYTIMRIDGVRIPHGFSASFSEPCITPGEKKHRIEIEFRNPATGESEYFNRAEFSYLVIDSCR